MGIYIHTYIHTYIYIYIIHIADCSNLSDPWGFFVNMSVCYIEKPERWPAIKMFRRTLRFISPCLYEDFVYVSRLC